MVRLESGQMQSTITEPYEVARSGISRVWDRFQETGNIRHEPKEGRAHVSISTQSKKCFIKMASMQGG